MAWKTPVFDREYSDAIYARRNQGNAENNKGALNYQDLNRIEDNHRFLMDCLKSGGYHLPHIHRNYTEIFTGKTYTDWQEENIPWLSEISRIRANYNALVRLFLYGLDLPLSKSSNYLAYTEVNDWERIAGTGKTMYENMVQEYYLCGTVNSGGDRLI